MKGIIIYLLILWPAAIFAQANFTVKGKISGPMSTLKNAYLYYNNGATYPSADSVVIKKGEFEIRGTMKDENHNAVTLSFGNNSSAIRADQRLSLFVIKGEQITIEVQGTPAVSKITGSPQSEMYQRVMDSLSRTKEVDAAFALLKRLILQYPDSKMALKAFSNVFGIGRAKNFPAKLPDISKLYSLFSTRIQNSAEGTAYSKYLENISRLVIGGTLADFSAKTPDGKVIKLSDFRGKYVLLDFWASWCIPCRAEFPYLKKAYTRFKNKNFEILGYSIDNDKSLWVSSIENDDVPWINLSNLVGSSDPIALDYQIFAIPANFLIGPDGKVIAVNLRGELLESQLEKFIK
jgi:peroxiredoxin